MSDPRQWLAERASQPGTLACALRHPNGTVISHSVDPSCPAATIENILNRFDALAAATAEATAPQWSTWAFEQGQIRLIERPDGWRLALAVRSDSPVLLSLDSLSREFLSVSFGS